MILFSIPKNAAVDEVREEMFEHLSQFKWTLVDSESSEYLDDAIAVKKHRESILMGSIEFSVDIYIFEQEELDCFMYSYKTFCNIEGVRREDIEDVDFVRDVEIKEMLQDRDVLGRGIGPKTLKNMVKTIENRLMSQAYKVLNLYGRAQD